MGEIPVGPRFPSGGTRPPHASDLYWCPPWGLSAPVPFLLVSLLFLRLRLYSSSCGLVALLVLVDSSVGEGVFGFIPLCTPYILLLCLHRRSLSFLLC